MEPLTEKQEQTALILDKVHDYVRIPGTMDVRLVGENHYIRLASGEHKLFAQNGRYWTEEGEVKYADVGEWFWELARKCSPEGRKRVGMKLPEELSHKEREELGVDKLWKCDECGEDVSMLDKGMHIAGHTLAKNKEKKKISFKKKPL